MTTLRNFFKPWYAWYVGSAFCAVAAAFNLAFAFAARGWTDTAFYVVLTGVWAFNTYILFDLGRLSKRRRELEQRVRAQLDTMFDGDYFKQGHN